jgi:DNA mismatch endonuclease, patch repair protein
VDTVSKERRSQIMARVRGKDTSPELRVRSLVHRLGYRFRLHRRDLPGRPDLVFPARKKVIFVHGCFWHRHQNCPANRTPKSRVEFWTAKLDGNAARDARKMSELKDMGWDALVIWECEVDRIDLPKRIRTFLGKGKAKVC